MAWPDYNQMVAEIWGSIYDGGSSFFATAAAASNIIVGGNPPYSVVDFFNFYPSFGGATVKSTAAIDGTTATIVVAGAAGVPYAAGQLIVGVGIVNGTTIKSVSGSGPYNIVLSQNTTISGSPVDVTTYIAPTVPLPIVNTYIFLAAASLSYNRYYEIWYTAMAYFIAHYLTLWAQSQQVGTTPNLAQLASSGLAVGVLTSLNAGDVSLSQEYLESLKNWGTWNLTIYGQLFATIAKAIASAGMLIW